MKSVKLNDLIVGQARKLVSLFSKDSKSKLKGILARHKGKSVIVRSRTEGVNFGVLMEADETGCVLRSARRIHRPVTKNGQDSWYEGVANNGLDYDRARISAAVEEKIIIEDYSVTLCTESAAKNISDMPSNKTSLI